jgi:hypothetical protein
MPVSTLTALEGLNEKLGRGGGIDSLSSPVGSFIISAIPPLNSNSDIDCRLVALENDDGAEDAEARAGKTNGGFGRGLGLFS